MRALERDHADALLDTRPVRRVPEIEEAPREEDDGTVFGAFIGMLVGVTLSLPLWAAVAVAVILLLG